MNAEVNVAARVAFALALVAAALPFAVAAYGGIGDLLPKSGPPSIGDGLGLLFGGILGLQWACFVAVPAVVVGFVSLARPARRLGIIAIGIGVPVAALSILLRAQF